MTNKYKNEIEWMDYCISRKQDVIDLYNIRMGPNAEPLNLENPQTIQDKLNWLKIYDSTFLKVKCSDKIKLREYCIEKIGYDLCIPILKIYDSFDDINFDELPDNYVLKTNHGSHTNIIVKNKNININKAKCLFDDWMSHDWTKWGLELAYEPIERKIFAEEYKSEYNNINNVLTDYKFLCFNGDPIYCQVISNRNSNKQHLNYYDMDFNFVDISRTDFKNDKTNIDKKPFNFEKMKEYSKIFAKDFKFVRVDFYDINNELYLGELTFFPAAGYLNYVNKNDSKKLGDLLKI